MKKIVLILALLSLAGCASYFKRKSCESINWFEHGKKVAMSGKWLNSDSTVVECRKVEAEIAESQLDQGFKAGMGQYCSKEQSYQTGKSGDFFARDLCEGPQINVLLNEHKKGVKDYCAKSNGQQAGASGKKYQNICPKDLEASFLVEYRKGRKRYVQAMVETRQSEIRDNETKISTIRGPLMYKQGRLSAMQNEKTNLETQKNFTPIENMALRSSFEDRINNVSSNINALRSDISSDESQIRSLEQANATKNSEINDFRSELPSLESN
jgi:hypothetical protein